MATIDFAYINPDTGARVNTESAEPAVETAMVGARDKLREGVSALAASDYAIKAQIPGVARDLLDASPTRARNDMTMGLLESIHSAGTTTLTVHIDESSDVAFVADVPVLIASSIEEAEAGDDTTEYEWLMPSAVGAAGSSQTLTVPSTSNSYYERAVVVQITAGDISLFGLGASKERWAEWGVRLQMERPDAPTVTADTAATSSITVTVALPSSNSWFGNYADLYVYETREEARRGPKPNAVCDSGDNDITGTTSISVAGLSTYGGGAAGGGGTVAAGTAYWITAVLKDKSGLFAQRQSLPAVPITDTTLS